VRVEYQAAVSVPATFQHAGYISAAAMDAYTGRVMSALPAAWLSGAVLLVALALLVGRRSRGALFMTLTALLVVAGGLCGLRAIVVAATCPHAAEPRFADTLYRMEGACAATEAWARDHGRLPTEAEWSDLAAGQPWARDGWDYPFVYQRIEKPEHDNQKYAIVSVMERDGRKPHNSGEAQMWEVPSWWMGPDGLYGTADDQCMLYELKRDGVLFPNRHAWAGRPESPPMGPPTRRAESPPMGPPTRRAESPPMGPPTRQAESPPMGPPTEGRE